MEIEQSEYLSKLQRYCAYRERCSSEVLQKMYQINVPEKWRSALIEELEALGYIDDARYASLFVRSKFNQNKWGKLKIKSGLIGKRVPLQIIETVLNEIDDEQYIGTLNKLLVGKFKTLPAMGKFKTKEKLIAYTSQREYEINLIYDALKEVELNSSED